MIQNPVLQGFAPDPSIIRVGEDYYIAVSTFEWWPGVRLFHSKNLEHFEQISSPIRRESQLQMSGNPDSCGVWAPDLSYDGKRFWLVFTDVKTRDSSKYYNTHNYVVWTDEISGEWSEPVYLNSTGFDPSLFHDRDGKTYLVNMINGFEGIQVQQFDTHKMELTGKAEVIYKGTGRGFTEGPHLYHVGEWYYLLMAEGGTSYEHCITMSRSVSLWGEYTEDPQNPVLTSDLEHPFALQKCGHGDLVETNQGEWYLVHLCARPDSRKKCVLGRETAVQKVQWNKEGWLRLSSGSRTGELQTESIITKRICHLPASVKDRDDFSNISLGVQYSTLRVPAQRFMSLVERKGWLRLYGRDFLNSHFEVGLIVRRQTRKKSGMICCMEFTAKTEREAAGAAYLYDSRNFYLLLKTIDAEKREMIQLLESRDGCVRIINELKVHESSPKIYLKIETDGAGERAAFFYSADENLYYSIGTADTGILTDEHCVGFTGAHFGLYCHDMEQRKNYADFKFFELL